MRRIPLNARIGTANGAAKLDEEAVRWILSRRYMSGREQGRMLGVDRRVIDRVKRREIWAHVPAPPIVCPACGKPHVCGTKPRKDGLCTECWKATPAAKEYHAKAVLRYRVDVGEVGRVPEERRVEIARTASSVRWAHHDVPGTVDNLTSFVAEMVLESAASTTPRSCSP